jgi:hypothetical protein
MKQRINLKVDTTTPFVLSSSKHGLPYARRWQAAPFDAACGVAQDRLRRAQGERNG